MKAAPLPTWSHDEWDLDVKAQASPAPVRFEEWTGARTVSTLGTNAGAATLPFQGWRRFKEAFAPELIQRAITETGRVHGVLDPFGGSGTTALAGQFLGVRPSTIEVNPFLADLIEAKIATYDLKAVVRAFAAVVSAVTGDVSNDAQDLLATAPATFVEPGVDGRYLFDRVVASRLCAYRMAIEDVDYEPARRLLKVMLASITVPASNAVVSGKGRRYRRRWQETTSSPGLVDRLFEQAVLAALFDLRRFETRSCLEYTLLRGDARELTARLGPAELAVFSPPYPNSFDYTDVYNIELWMLGYLRSGEDNRALRDSTLRSHVQIKRDMTCRGTATPTLERTLAKMDGVREKLWNPHLPSMVGAYFDDMAIILRALHKCILPNGRVYMVVGDSRYAGVDVPVATILAEEAPSHGFEIIQTEPFRSMRSSPQQGGHAVLAETLVVLRRGHP